MHAAYPSLPLFVALARQSSSARSSFPVASSFWASHARLLLPATQEHVPRSHTSPALAQKPDVPMRLHSAAQLPRDPPQPHVCPFHRQVSNDPLHPSTHPAAHCPVASAARPATPWSIAA